MCASIPRIHIGHEHLKYKNISHIFLSVNRYYMTKMKTSVINHSSEVTINLKEPA